MHQGCCPPAGPPMPAGQSQAMLEQMENHYIANGKCPPGCAKWFLPITVTLTASGTDSTEAEPQRPFRGVRIFIPSAIASDVVVRDFKVANQSQFAASGEIDGQVFSEVSEDSMVIFQATWSTNKYELELRNKTASPIVVNAGLLGYVKI